MTNIEQRLEEYIREITNADVNSDTPLIENGMIDSMGVMDLLAFIKENFHIEFSDDDLTADNFRNIRAIAYLIESRNKEQTR
jgi:acyl carrier protein